MTFPTAAGDIGQVTDVRYGNDGCDGHGGFEVCVLGYLRRLCAEQRRQWCARTDLHRQRPGLARDDHHRFQQPPGIIAASIGGNGGDGGSAGGVGGSAAQGGVAGPGGNVTVNNYTTIVTSGIGSHGIFAKSMAGKRRIGRDLLPWLLGRQRRRRRGGRQRQRL